MSAGCPDPSTTEPHDVARWVLGTNMPLDKEERDFLRDLGYNDNYIYFGQPINLIKLQRLRIFYWMAVGFTRKDAKDE